MVLFVKRFCALSLLFLLANPLHSRYASASDTVAYIQICLIVDVSGSMEGLLYQAQFYRLLGTDQALHLALANLAEVYRIAGRGAQQLLLVHFHLEAAQVLPAARQAAIEWAGIDAKVFATPDQHVQTAESIMSKTGYRLPTAELSQIKAILA